MKYSYLRDKYYKEGIKYEKDIQFKNFNEINYFLPYSKFSKKDYIYYDYYNEEMNNFKTFINEKKNKILIENEIKEEIAKQKDEEFKKELNINKKNTQKNKDKKDIEAKIQQLKKLQEQEVQAKILKEQKKDEEIPIELSEEEYKKHNNNSQPKQLKSIINNKTKKNIQSLQPLTNVPLPKIPHENPLDENPLKNPNNNKTKKNNPSLRLELQ